MRGSNGEETAFVNREKVTKVEAAEFRQAREKRETREWQEARERQEAQERQEEQDEDEGSEKALVTAPSTSDDSEVARGPSDGKVHNKKWWKRLGRFFRKRDKLSLAATGHGAVF